MPSIQLILEAPAVQSTAQRLAGLNIPRLLREQIGAWAQEGQRSLEAATPVRTGRLQRSWQTDVRPQEAVIENPTPYATFVLQGTQPHRIEGHPFLRFLAGDQVAFARSVQHPGTRGDAQLQDAITHLIGQGLEGGQHVAAMVAEEVTGGA